MANHFDFTDRTALITGAASGIGLACARWLAHRGAALVLVDRDEAGLAQLGLDCACASFSGDVADPALWDHIEAETGPLDHAIVNAGIASGGAISEMAFDEWRRVLSVNLDGAFLSLSAVLRGMREGGSAARQIRVNAIAPGGVDTPIWDELPFFQELVGQTGDREAAIEAMARMATPLARYAKPEEIAGQIGFLLSDMARNITGAVLVSDGGYSL